MGFKGILTDWIGKESDAFEACKIAPENQITLPHLETTKRVCVFTDASENSWFLLVTKVPLKQIWKSHRTQNRSTLESKFGSFKLTQIV